MNAGLQSLISDISISMFRVASIIGHANLKSELEKSAIAISANPCPDNIYSAKRLISLGQEIGEIKPINAIVLIRELENLRKGLLSVSVLPVQDVDISSVFVRNTQSVNAFNVSEKYSVKDLVMPSMEAGHISYKDNYPAQKQTRQGAGKKPIFNPDKVYQYIAERRVTRLKDLESAFTEVSTRTVRRVTESLIKKGRIERVGTPGPNSFYRVPILKEVKEEPKISEKEPAFNSSPISPNTQNVIAL